MNKKLPVGIVNAGVWQFLEEFNLPRLLAGQAGEALSRLIGGAVDIPASKLQQYAQGIQDNTKAKSMVSEAIGVATAEMAVRDPELLERAKVAFVNDLVSEQTNREAVGVKMVQHLDNQEISKGVPPIEADWMNVFSSYAKHASSENMRDLLGRILAGEIRKSGEFSIPTLRLIAELDKKTADIFQKLLPLVISGGFIPGFCAESEIYFHDLMVLIELGILNPGPGLGVLSSQALHKGDNFLFWVQNYGLVVVADIDIPKIETEIIPLSRVGCELLKLFDYEADLEILKKFSNTFQVDGVKSIHLAPTVHRPEGLSCKTDDSTIIWTEQK